MKTSRTRVHGCQGPDPSLPLWSYCPSSHVAYPLLQEYPLHRMLECCEQRAGTDRKRLLRILEAEMPQVFLVHTPRVQEGLVVLQNG